MIEWYRRDERAMIWGVWARAVLVLLTGVLTVMLILVTGRPYGLGGRIVITLLGLACTGAGPLILVRGLLRIMRDETYIAVQHDGLVYVRGKEITFHAWDSIEQAITVSDGDRLRLALVLRDKPNLVIEESFFDMTVEELAKRINHLRTKILMGLNP